MKKGENEIFDDVSFSSECFVWSSRINNADKKELMSLKGVGKVKAASIVEFRKGHCFLNVGELSLVKGIGSKTIAKNDLIARKCK